MTQKNKLLKRYFQVLALSLGIGSLITAAALWFYIQSTGASPASLIGGLFDSVPARTTFAVLGLDADATRTDVIIVGSFNKESGAIDMVSIPRDTFVKMPKERVDVLTAEGRFVPADGGMKINAVHHYSGDHGIEFTLAQLEDIFGIEIDYYARVNLEAFRCVVDAIGGVEFDVPQRMYYSDPEQDLYIDLQPGLQTLSGAQAEQLVRYRKADINNPLSEGYARGDLQRVEVQQAFMKALLSQVLEKRNLLNATGAIVTTVFKYVDTNFGIDDIPQYLKYLSSFSPEDITSASLPGDAGSINGQSYVIIRESEARDLIESIFSDAGAVAEDSFEKGIIVLNGGQTNGKANEVRKTLEAAGYTVDSIGDFSGALQDKTRILVRKRGQGEDLQAFFKESEIIIDPQTDCDIKIVIGIGE